MSEEAALVFKDRYEVVRELDRGGMCVVYLARDCELLSRLVVVKVLLEESRQDGWIRQKFLQEMEALARIDHPGVVGVLDTGLTVEGHQFLVMQYIEGSTLRGAIESGEMNFVRAASLIRQIGQALAATHEKGVWHRDLKPENIMLQRLGAEDHVKLIDFGIARVQNSQFNGEKTNVAGSLNYMAPEQFAGNPDAASDTFALGVIAYELLTGKKPFPIDSMTRMVAEDQAKPPLPRSLRPDLPEAAERSIMKALSFRPECRQVNILEFSEMLARELGGTESIRNSDSKGTVEIAHVLFTDLVGYSLLAMDQQKDYLRQLQNIVHESPQARASVASGNMISLPTGDGIALAFFQDPTAPAQCALEVAFALKAKPHLKLRMGIHSGPVYRIADVNANANLSGGGINMAQRVMDCGDAGHILVSKSTAEVLLQLNKWSPYLTDLGEYIAKHGVKVSIWSLCTAEVGNRERPQKLSAVTKKATISATVIGILICLMVVASLSLTWFVLWKKGFQINASNQPTIAVLPFEDMSPEKDQQFFADGLAEDLLTGLAKIPGLRVAGKTSSFQFRDKKKDFGLIGNKLNVLNILDGSVRQQGNRARITARLIRTDDGIQIWSEKFDREMDNVLDVQENIALAVTNQLRIKLIGTATLGSINRNLHGDAYIDYLRGRHFAGQNDKQSLEQAAHYFDKAIKLDPAYAPFWVGKAGCLTSQVSSEYLPLDGIRQASEAVKKALLLDENLGEAHAALAEIQMLYDWDWVGAGESFKRALALEPGNASVLRGAAALARFMGDLDNAIALQRRAIMIDPLVARAYKNFGLILQYAGKQEEATIALNRALELNSQTSFAHYFLSQVHLAQGRLQESLIEAGKEPILPSRLLGLTLAYDALGRKKESEINLAQLMVREEKAFYQVAEVYAFRRENTQAFEWLEKAYLSHDPSLSEIKCDPLLNNLRSDPRYRELLKKMRLPF